MVFRRSSTQNRWQMENSLTQFHYMCAQFYYVYAWVYVLAFTILFFFISILLSFHSIIAPVLESAQIMQKIQKIIKNLYRRFLSSLTYQMLLLSLLMFICIFPWLFFLLLIQFARFSHELYIQYVTNWYACFNITYILKSAKGICTISLYVT